MVRVCACMVAASGVCMNGGWQWSGCVHEWWQLRSGVCMNGGSGQGVCMNGGSI